MKLGFYRDLLLVLLGIILMLIMNFIWTIFGDDVYYLVSLSLMMFLMFRIARYWHFNFLLPIKISPIKVSKSYKKGARQ